MALLSITAQFECEGCGKRFPIKIDAASRRPQKWTIYDIAEDALRDEVGIENGKHRCKECLASEDSRHEFDCRDPDCSGCKIEPEEVAVGAPVKQGTIDQHQLRRPGESLSVYLIRAGIKKTWPMPKRGARNDP